MKNQVGMSETHRQEVRRRILNVTKELLVKYGYKKTTIRLIVHHSGVLIGSIYYIFRNKEEIFQSIIMEMVDNALRKIDAHCPEESPAFRYAAACAVEIREMEAAPIIRDVYKEGYDSPLVFESMVDQYTHMCHHYFDGTPLAARDEEYYERMLLLKGAMRGCIGELYFKKQHDHARSRRRLLSLALHLFHLPEEEITQIVERIELQNDLWLTIANELAMRPIGE